VCGVRVSVSFAFATAQIVWGREKRIRRMTAFNCKCKHFLRPFVAGLCLSHCRRTMIEQGENIWQSVSGKTDRCNSETLSSVYSDARCPQLA
jgi:hypothetical protein